MRRLTGREKRLSAYLGVFFAVVGWDALRRRWSPDITITTEHYTIYSTATVEQTREIGDIGEALYGSYVEFLKQVKRTPQSHGKLKMKLFKDRDEFRFCNRVSGWAEAFYRKPYCCQYYSAEEANPYHWMVHEATHQLNAEVAGLSLAKWLEEGIADYFGTSRIISNRLALGQIDTNTYPVWWLNILATSGNLDTDKANMSVIPLRSIISGSGGPDIDEFFNLYYLHWWSLTHFLMHYEDGRYRNGAIQLIGGDSDVGAFERHIGNIEDVEREWYQYVLDLKRKLCGLSTFPLNLRRLRSALTAPLVTQYRSTQKGEGGL